MDLQTLLDRAEIIDLISAYNKASFYCRVLAYVLTHDQVFGADVENNFRAAGWNGPPTVTRPAVGVKPVI